MGFCLVIGVKDEVENWEKLKKSLSLLVGLGHVQQFNQRLSPISWTR